ncbi:MAG: hypothetical protein EGR46_00255 [Ruminococcus sp.]|uniref:hypothetical protein n=2 Tax=Ruminococcus sp. TaxID=41978 RepID=UPI0025EF8B15|nr:hypothetical protein [Ruminococcus sp.]MBD9047369.1 hypothetical protein [Ruminococcus sp.]
MSNSAKELARLITENPELLVVPMVDSDIVDDDCCGRYKGSFGKCSVGEYAVYRERVYFDKEDFEEAYYDYNCDELCEKFNYNPRVMNCPKGKYSAEKIAANEENAKELNNYLRRISDKVFKKAIIVNIDMPENE